VDQTTNKYIYGYGGTYIKFYDTSTGGIDIYNLNGTATTRIFGGLNVSASLSVGGGFSMNGNLNIGNGNYLSADASNYNKIYPYNGANASMRFILGHPTVGNFEWEYPTNTVLMTLKRTGNFLVGTTTDSGYKLDVSGSTRVSGTSTLQGAVAVNSTNVSTGYALFVNGVIGATSVTLTQNLTMGENYAISNNGSQTIDIDANNDSTNAVFRVTANGTANELFRVNETGSFGIGTTTPNYKLDVSGSARITNGLIISSSTTINDELVINIPEVDGPIDDTRPAGFYKATVNGAVVFLPYYL